MDVDVAQIVRGLTKAQADCVLWIGDDVKLASDVDAEVGAYLFEQGIITQIQAAGYGFTNLTELGLQVRAALDTTPGAAVAGGSGEGDCTDAKAGA